DDRIPELRGGVEFQFEDRECVEEYRRQVQDQVDEDEAESDPQGQRPAEFDIRQAHGENCSDSDGSPHAATIEYNWSKELEEDLLGTQLIQVLGPFVKAHRLGVVLGAQAPFRVIRRDVRLPDVAFISTENWRTWKRSRPSVAGFAPDLAIEILSKSNTRAEM